MARVEVGDDVWEVESFKGVGDVGAVGFDGRGTRRKVGVYDDRGEGGRFDDDGECCAGVGFDDGCEGWD